MFMRIIFLFISIMLSIVFDINRLRQGSAGPVQEARGRMRGRAGPLHGGGSAQQARAARHTLQLPWQLRYADETPHERA